MDETTSEKKACPCAIIKDAWKKLCAAVAEMPVIGPTLRTIRKICDGATGDKGLRWISLAIVYGGVAYVVLLAFSSWIDIWSLVGKIPDAWSAICLVLLNLLWPIVFTITVTHFVRRADALISQVTTSDVPAIAIITGLLKATAESMFVAVLWSIPLILIFAIINPEAMVYFFAQTSLLDARDFWSIRGYGDAFCQVLSSTLRLIVTALSSLIIVRVICEVLDLAIRAVGSLEAIRDASKK